MRFFRITSFLVLMRLVINPGDDPGCLHDGRVSLHAGVWVVGRCVTAGARNHDQLVRSGQVEETLGICRSLFARCRRTLREYRIEYQGPLRDVSTTSNTADFTL